MTLLGLFNESYRLFSSKLRVEPGPDRRVTEADSITKEKLISVSDREGCR